jgi:mannan endo-1,4-beta-mannosidase
VSRDLIVCKALVLTKNNCFTMRFIAIFCLLCLCLACQKESNGPDPDTNPGGSEPPKVAIDTASKISLRSKAGILAYFQKQVKNSKVLTGQHCGDGDNLPQLFNDYVENLSQFSTKYVSVLGADFGFKPNNNFNAMNETLIKHWQNKGLVTISWHADNPFQAGAFSYRWNSVQNKVNIDLKALLKTAPDSEAKRSYRQELDQVAKALQALKAAGVVVIWRPFHEMNADWFWWGIDAYQETPGNAPAYIALWRDLHQTMTQDYGLDNMIWTFSPNARASWTASLSAQYPGDAFVDLVGEDYYGPSPAFPGYEELSKLNKPIVLCETGPNDKAYGQWDEAAIVNATKGKAIYFLQWHSWPGAKVAIIDNQNYRNMMTSLDAVSREEL